MDAPLVGRDDELRLIAESHALARQGQAQVVWLQGDAGAGKTTLLQRAVELASAVPAARCCVLRVTCDPAERLIEHGVSQQLLRRAMGAVPDAAPSSTLHAELLLEHLAAQQDTTVVLALDDLHWCDNSSLQTLRYALRRLDGLRVLAVLAHRPMEQDWPAEVRRSLGPVGSRVVAVQRLRVDDVRALAAASGVPLTRRAAARLHEHTHGNAQLVATVLAEVPASELAASAGPIPAPRSFSEWVHQAFAAADPEQRAVVATVALLDRAAGLGEIAALSQVGEVAAAVDRAVGGRLLRHAWRGGEEVVDVAHALVRSAIAEALPLAEAARLHARAAGAVADPVQAMRHRLLACGRHDPALAEAAVELADRQAAEGALFASAQLLALCQRALPGGAERNRVRVRAAEQLTRMGEVRWASRLLAEGGPARDGAQDPYELFVEGQLALQMGEGARAASALSAAWELQQDVALGVGAAELLAYLAWDHGDGAAAVLWAERALAAAEEPGVTIRFASTALVAGWATQGSPGRARPQLVGLLDSLRGTESEADLRTGLSIEAMWRSDLAAAEAYLAFEDSAASGGMDVGGGVGREALRQASSKVVKVELGRRMGHWDQVAALTRAEMAALDEGWDSRTASMTLPVGAVVAAARGEEAFAEQILSRTEELAAGLSGVPSRTLMAMARAFLRTIRGEWAGVVAHLLPLQEDPVTRVIPECVYAWRGDLAQALARLGRIEEAEEVLAGPGATGLSAYGASSCLLGAAAVAAARGSLAEAEDRLRAAVDLGAGPVLQVRAELALGSLLRRRGHRRAAAQHLERALAGATALGAASWGTRAERELAMSGLRPSAGEELTPSEREVAQLAVQGMKNREIAEHLSVSVKTVESHLTKVFVKVGVRHRVELVRALGSDG